MLQSNGALTGTPAGSGSYNVSVQVSDASGQTVQRSLTLVVAPTGVSVNAASLPPGKFDAPYAYALSASGGQSPYHWSLAPNSTLPAGLSLDANSGTIAGDPGQAGIWSVGIVVTDSQSTPSTGTVTLPLTIGLATGYAGGENCYMPYPATPLYYPGALSWHVDASALQGAASQMTLLSGHILTGCLQAVATGSYGLVLTAVDASQTPHTLTLPLPVVGQGTLDNGTVHFYSGGVAQYPLPDGTQQGVALANQPFTAIGTSGELVGGDYPFAGNFLFGLSGGTPQVCTSNPAAQVNLTAPSPGRFEVLFNGTTQTCSSPLSFPTTPTSLAVYSIDVLNNPVAVSGVTAKNVSVAGASNVPASNVQHLPYVIQFQPSSAESIPVSLTFNYTVDESGCNGPNCIVQLQYGLNTDATPQGCAYNGVAGASGASGTASVTVNVPNVGGRYYVAIDKSLQYSCTGGWNRGQPSASQYIAVIDVEK
jgi:hypothetical protein